jgi:hypothetical protein
MAELEPQQSADSPWIVIHDEVIPSEELVKEVERRVAQRRQELGGVNLVFPTFGHVSTFPEPSEADNGANPHLYYYLKEANQTPARAVEPVLAPSPATRMPVIGRLWGTIRGEMHNLVLFYVNRSVADQNKLNVNLVSALNELTRVVQAQRAEIESLRAEIRRLKG